MFDSGTARRSWLVRYSTSAWTMTLRTSRWPSASSSSSVVTPGALPTSSTVVGSRSTVRSVRTPSLGFVTVLMGFLEESWSLVVLLSSTTRGLTSGEQVCARLTAGTPPRRRALSPPISSQGFAKIRCIRSPSFQRPLTVQASLGAGKAIRGLIGPAVTPNPRVCKHPIRTHPIGSDFLVVGPGQDSTSRDSFTGGSATFSSRRWRPVGT